MTNIDIERGWSIWPKDDPSNEEHPHHNLSVKVLECSGAVILEIADDAEEEHRCVSAVLNAQEWRELTSLPIRFTDPDEIASED